MVTVVVIVKSNGDFEQPGYHVKITAITDMPVKSCLGGSFLSNNTVSLGASGIPGVPLTFQQYFSI